MNTNRTPALASPMPARACASCAAEFTPRVPYMRDALGSVALGAVCCVACEAGVRAAWAPTMPTRSHASN